MKPAAIFCFALTLAALAGCDSDGGDDGGGGGAALQTLGEPVEGLSQSELDSFNRGRAVFTKRFAPSEGLGPRYNTTSCVNCHETPVVGGSATTYRNFFLVASGNQGAQQPLPPAASIAFPSYGSRTSNAFTLTDGRMVIPTTFFGAPITASHRNALTLFGVGQFEFVSDATIMSHSDPDDADGDGISGRVNFFMGSVGRFGVKCQSNNIEAFVRAPLNNQMGITTNPFLGSAGIVSLACTPAVQAAGNPDTPTADNDGIPDPEMSTGDLGDLINFTRFMAPPKPKPFSAAAQRGNATFLAIGCAKCHIPELPTTRGYNIAAYTDLLIHDLGAANADGITQGVPQASQIAPQTIGSEFRTQPLWGFSAHGPFMHNGAADTIVDAILMHGGEAQAIRDAFNALTQAQKDDVIAFLEAL